MRNAIPLREPDLEALLEKIEKKAAKKVTKKSKSKLFDDFLNDSESSSPLFKPKPGQNRLKKLAQLDSKPKKKKSPKKAMVFGDSEDSDDSIIKLGTPPLKEKADKKKR